MEKREKIELVIEQLEERIAPGVVTAHNNNGIGNGPESGPAPGNSGSSNSPFAGDFSSNNGR
jgi:hypothetical protein